MKLFHISDLHLGKRVNEYSMLEDQKYILTRILNIVDDERPDGLLIAGDVYDKSVPSCESVQLFAEFLVELAEDGIAVFIISGNHDSPERLAFGGRLIDRSGIHLSPVYDGGVRPHSLYDAHGRVNIYMLPFVKPVNVRAVDSNEDIVSYTDAVAAAIKRMQIDQSERNVLVTHQFVTGASRSGSEELSVGGTDNVDAAVFKPFDYVALGHIHSPQNIGSERIRYCGSPLKYSFSEVGQTKSITVVELGAKGELALSEIPLKPLRELHELRGSYAELTRQDYYRDTTLREDYVHITLTDNEDIPEAYAKLRVIYRRLMRLDYDNARTRAGIDPQIEATADSLNPLELFMKLYEKQNAVPMPSDSVEYTKKLIESVWEKQT